MASIATGILTEIATAVILVGVVLAVAAWFAGPSRFAVPARRWLAPYLEANPVATYGVVVAVLLLIFIWQPIPATGTPVGMIVFTVLALLGTETLRREARVEFGTGPTTGGAPVALATAGGPSIPGGGQLPPAGDQPTPTEAPAADPERRRGSPRRSDRGPAAYMGVGRADTGAGEPGGRPGKRRRLDVEHIVDVATDRYGLVLLLLLLTYVLSSALPDPLVAGGVDGHRRSHGDGHAGRLQRPQTPAADRHAAGGAAVLISLIAAVVGGRSEGIPGAISAILLATCLVAIIVRISKHDHVSSQTLLGAMCCYVLFGLVYTFIFAAIGKLGSAPFLTPPATTRCRTTCSSATPP